MQHFIIATDAQSVWDQLCYACWVICVVFRCDIKI